MYFKIFYSILNFQDNRWFALMNIQPASEMLDSSKLKVYSGTGLGLNFKARVDRGVNSGVL